MGLYILWNEMSLSSICWWSKCPVWNQYFLYSFTWELKKKRGWKKTRYSPKWWFNGDLPWQKVKNHLSKSNLLITCNHCIQHMKFHPRPESRLENKNGSKEIWGNTWLRHSHTPLMPIGPMYNTFTYIWLQRNMVHPRKLTCHLKRDQFKRRNYIFQPSIFRNHVSFQGG